MERVFDKIVNILAWAAGILLMAALVMVCVDVLFRYFLNDPIAGTLQFSEYIMLYIPFLAAPYVLKEDAHIKVDVFLNMMKPATQILFKIFTSILSAFVTLILTYYGIITTFEYYMRGVSSIKYYKIPEYLVIVIIPIGCLFFALQFFRGAFNSYKEYLKQRWNGGKL